MNSAFQSYKLNAKGVEVAQDVAESFDKLLGHLEVLAWPNNECREMSIVKTKLEEASFFAKKAISRVKSYQSE